MKPQRLYTLTERAKHLAEWKASTLNLPEYSKQTGIPLTSLRYWIYGVYKKVKAKQPKISGFLPIQITEDGGPNLEVILDLPRGMRMTLRGALTPGHLKALIS